LLRRGLVELVDPRETGALRIHVVALVVADDVDRDDVTAREAEYARVADGRYDADGTCGDCGTRGYGCDCHARPVGGWPADQLGTNAGRARIPLVHETGRAYVGVAGRVDPLSHVDPPGWSGPVRGSDGAAVSWELPSEFRGGSA
jgi:hypothetical protein